MNKKRNVVLVVLFSLFTLGIYSIYWTASINNQVNKIIGDDNIHGGTVILLGFLTCGIYYFVWYYKIAARIQMIQEAKGIDTESKGLLYIILKCFGLGIVCMVFVQLDINDLVREE